MKRLLALALCMLVVFAAAVPTAHAESLLESAAEAAGTEELTRGLSEEERRIL